MEKRNRAKLFDLRMIPLDGARLVYLTALLPLFRLRRLTPEGEKYKGILHGPAVIVANHADFSDALVMGATFWYRRMYWLTGEAVMQGKARTFWLKAAGAIEIDRRKADIEAIWKATDVLKQGRLLGIFPEGSIQRGNRVQSIKSGCVLMAVQADVPIVPIHILPCDKWYKRRSVVIGNAIDPNAYLPATSPTAADLDRVAEVVLAEMNRCNPATKTMKV